MRPKKEKIHIKHNICAFILLKGNCIIIALFNIYVVLKIRIFVAAMFPLGSTSFHCNWSGGSTWFIYTTLCTKYAHGVSYAIVNYSKVLCQNYNLLHAFSSRAKVQTR